MTRFRNSDVDGTESTFRILLLLWSTSSGSTQSAENAHYLCKEVKNHWKLVLIAASALVDTIYRFEAFTSDAW